MSALDGLNEQQCKAARATTGQLLIIAGPGTGKTKTLAARIVHLLQSGAAKPEEVVALTFTNKSAREMQQRVSAQLDGSIRLTIATFHALAGRLLTDIQTTLATQQEITDITKHVKRSMGQKGLSERDIVLAITRAKNRTTPVDDPLTKQLVDIYNLELASRGLHDFDDMLTMLKAHLTENISPFTHVLVDEFQDTNDIQYEILKLLASNAKSVFAIGDPLQSIYGFRGASAGVFDRFKADWPTAETIRLETNYRSTPQVVRASAAVFPEEPALHPNRADQGSVQIIETLNEYAEADWVVHEIEQQLGGSTMISGSKHHTAGVDRTFKNFAVLYRTHATAKALQRSLENSGLPFQVAGEGSPYLQPEVQAIIQAMRYIAGQGPAPSVKGLTSSQVKHLLDDHRDELAKLSLSPLASYIVNTLSIETERNSGVIRQFIQSLVRIDTTPLPDFMPYISKLADQEYYDPNAEVISLLTIHAVKGLEFSQVFLIGTEEDILPLSKKGQIADIEEERRLFYVAATRAKDDLYILHTRSRGKEKAELSRFARQLPESVATRIVDPAIAGQVAKIKKRAQKKAQSSLF
jgi:superfamily I DNA/RNA helicase